MNIESSKITPIQESQEKKSSNTTNNSASTSFADELKEISNENKKDSPKTEKAEVKNEKEQKENINNVKNEEKNNNKLNEAIEGLSTVVKELNQSEDKLSGSIKKDNTLDDNTNMINKDFNIQENKDLMPQMNPNMNFSSDGQAFSSFMNNENKKNTSLRATAQDLAEEAEILSTMTENIAIANKNQLLKETATIANQEGVKKVNTQTGVTIENIVKYDSIIMNQADVEVFVSLVENKEININNLDLKEAEKSVQISKTLADMLAKSMEKNQPLRIDFDNNISVIIRISRDGKISADFLPSSQIAEAYLKENLPLLRQRFEEKNIEYDSLNQRERRDSNKDNNRRKDRNNE